MGSRSAGLAGSIGFFFVWTPSVLAGAGALGLSTQAAENLDNPTLTLWNYSTSLRAGAGYNDNILLGHSNPQGSGFVATGAEFFLLRLGERGPRVQVYVSGDDTRYLSGDSVDKEQLVFVQAQISGNLATKWSGSFGAEYTFQDQVLDVSVTESDLTTARVLANSFQANPALRHDFSTNTWIELKTPISRRIFEAPLDDYWEGGPRLVLTLSRKWEWQAGYEYTRRLYDSRTQFTADGTSIPGTSLELGQHDARLQARGFLDKGHRWRTTTRIASRRTHDNGSGYFSYWRIQGGQQIRFRSGGWEATAEAKAGFYRYDVQQSGGPGSGRRERTELMFAARCEKSISRSWKWYAEYEYERTLAGDPLEEYSVNSARSGFAWEF